ncbi:MAG: FAD-dependent monooxygenase [Bradyrhizobium sp.]
MTARNDKTIDVLVVGGGGCGLATSIFLADKGVDFLTIERHASTSILPKAHYLNQRTMEIFRQHGLADDVYAQGTPPYNRSKTKWYTSLGGDNPLAGKPIFEMGTLGGQGTPRIVHYLETSPTDTANLPQIRLEPLIKSHAEKRGAARIRFSCELVEFTQDADGVTATIRDVNTKETQTVRAKYLVAADGGRTVGRMLGIAMEGPTKLITQISVHFEADLSQWIPDDRVLLNWLKPMHRQGVSVIVPMGPGKWGRNSPEWSLGFPRMPFDPPAFSDEAATEEVRKILGIADLPVKVRCVSEWAVEGVLAERYRVGRVFLAGDAAHRHPPTTGLGLNTGIQDAHNLAWKLALAVSAKAGDKLLDSYEAERRPVGAFNVEWALNAFFNHILLEMGIVAVHPNNLSEVQTPGHVIGAVQALFADSANGRMRRDRLSTIFNTQAIEFYAQDVELGFVYDSSAVVGDGSPAPERPANGQHYTPTSRPGHRLPHCWLDRQGAKLSTHDLIGREGDFVLLVRNKGTQWRTAVEAAAEATGAAIRLVVVARGGDALDAEARWAELSGVGADGAVLVRPDNMVGWRSASLPAQADAELTRVMRTVLGR